MTTSNFLTVWSQILLASGGFELCYEYKGYWSRRINKNDRLIYRVEEQIVTVLVVSAMGHYSDK